MARQQITYRGLDMPDVEVEVEGTWFPGELRMWTQDDDGAWTGQVQWHGPDGTHIDTLPAERVRQDEVDRARRRGQP